MAERQHEDETRRQESAVAHAYMAHLRQWLAGLPPTVLAGHMDALYTLLYEGCRAGLHRAMRHVPRAEVAGLFAVLSPEYGEAQTQAAFRAASPGAVYGVLVLSYVWCVQALEAHGADTLGARARLQLCLKHPIVPSPAKSAARATAQSRPDGQQRQRYPS